jgi:hypothetical protein
MFVLLHSAYEIQIVSPIFDTKIFAMQGLILITSVLLGQAAAQCSRATLQELAEGYHASVTSGKMNVPVAANLVYTENFKAASPGNGILSKPVKTSLHRHLLDTTACAPFTEIIAHENTPPYVIGTQIHYTDGKASKIEAVITSKENGWLFDASATYKWASKESRPAIAEGQRDSRAVIQAVADAYLDKFSNGDTPVPIATPCERLEGKMHIAPNCIAGMPTAGSGKAVANMMTNRRYVIDEVMGTVDVFLNFRGMPDSHEYRVENGKLKIVHTITAGTLGGMPKSKGAKGKGPKPM